MNYKYKLVGMEKKEEKEMVMQQLRGSGVWKME